jgi:hypothetical protein
MDDLIGRRVAPAGVDQAAAAKAVGIILQFLSKEVPAEEAHTLRRHVPDVDAALPATCSSLYLRSPGMPGAISMMEVGSQLVSAGLSTRQIQAVSSETLKFAREKAGDGAVGDIVGAIPGLGQLV